DHSTEHALSLYTQNFYRINKCEMRIISTGYSNSGSTRTSCFIAEYQSGHVGSLSKLYDSRIQPWQSSPVQDQTVVSISGTGSFGPRAKDITTSPFIMLSLLYLFHTNNERNDLFWCLFPP